MLCLMKLGAELMPHPVEAQAGRGPQPLRIISRLLRGREIFDIFTILGF